MYILGNVLCIFIFRFIAWELANGQDPECMGIFFGFIGRIKCPVMEDSILLVKESVLVGELPSGHAIHKIKSIAMFNPVSEVIFSK